MKVNWLAPDGEHPARAASRRSMDAVSRGNKADWLALFTPDALVEDPVGPSAFDPEGTGHRGHEAISAFWDATIGNAESIEFTVRDSFAAGDEVANIGTITTFLPGGHRVDTDGVYVYRVGPDGLIRSLRAFWEFDRAMATLRPA
jgi:steroid Delta-isomerase